MTNRTMSIICALAAVFAFSMIFYPPVTWFYTVIFGVQVIALSYMSISSWNRSKNSD